MKSRQITNDVIRCKVYEVGIMLRGPPPSQALVSSLASFIHHNYITTVENMRLENINLSEVSHASALADVTVTNYVTITNVSGNIAPIISRIECRRLFISKMRLSTGYGCPHPGDADLS